MPTWIVSLFGNPWMLVWLPAAAVPIVIHLWNRRKYRDVSWAAMEYLLAAIVKSSRRMRIEQLLLLVVRTLLILLVVMALAEPFLNAVAAPFVAGARTLRVLVIDGSYSMDLRPADKSVFELAKQRAIQIVDDGSQGDAYALVQMSDSPRVVVGTPAFDPAEFVDEIENLKLKHGGADLDKTLQAVEEIIRQVRRDQPQLSRHHVYFLTDLGRNTWAGDGRSEEADKELTGRLERLSEQGVVEVVPLGMAASDNVAVTSLRSESAYATIRRPVRLQATLRSFAPQARLHQLAELWIDGRRVDQQFVDVLPGDETPPLVFDYRFTTPGDHAIEARLSGDLLDVDNHRYLVLPVKEHLDALLVSGKRQSTLPVEAALDGGDFRQGLQGTIRPQVVPESALLELDLNRYDCVFLCNVGQFTASEAQVLRAYLEQGGGLVTFLGDQVRAERYNRELAGGREDGLRVLPARLGTAFCDGEYHFVDPLDYKHPMLAKWRGNPETGLTSVPVLKYIRLELPEKSEANVVMSLDTGDPLVVEESILRGRSILVATDVSTTSVIDAGNPRPWSLIASWLNSQVFLDGLWKAAMGGRIQQRNVQVGESFGAEYKQAVTDSRLNVTTPAGPKEKAALGGDADAGRWSFDETELSGIYAVRVDDGTADDEKKFAVNVDTRESDPEKLHPEDLPARFVTRTDWQDVDIHQSADLPAPALGLHRLLLVCVLGLLFAETFLAWWIGHHKA